MFYILCVEDIMQFIQSAVRFEFSTHTTSYKFHIDWIFGLYLLKREKETNGPMNMRACLVVLLFISQLMFLFQVELCAAINPDEVIVISNRQPKNTDGMLSFENKVDPSEKLGFYLVKQSDENTLTTSLIDSIYFVSQLTKPGISWVVFVHGDSKTFEEAATRGLKIQQKHNIGVTVFSWPTKEPGANGRNNFRNSKRQAELTVVQLASLMHILQLSRESHPDHYTEHSLSLFAHSLGNYLLKGLVRNNLLPQPQSIIFDNIVLNAPAVNQLHHKNWLNEINLQQQLFVISNRHDFNLKGVRIFTSAGKQLGEIVKPPFSEHAYYIDFSKSVGFRFPTGTTHTYFIGSIPDKSENIRCFYTDILHGRVPDFADDKRFRARKSNGTYDILF